MPNISTHRHFYIDYLRAYMVVLVVLEHSLLPFSPHFKNIAYIADSGGDLFFDVLHYHNDAIMMPFLFLLAGIFVMASLKRRGYLGFCQEKFYRLVVPFILGVMLLVPPQTFFQYLIKEDPTIGYLEYLKKVYFFDHMTASGFWFLYYLFVLTFGLLLVHHIFPSFVNLCGRFVFWLTSKPTQGFLVFFLVTSIILGISDLLWGPFFWEGFGIVFYVRGSRFIVKILFFLIGVGVANIGLERDTYFLKGLGNIWYIWVLLAFIFGGLYMSYSLMYYHEGAYNYELLLFLKSDGTWGEAWDILTRHVTPVIIRTTLLGLFMCSLTTMYFAVFYQFLSKANAVGMSLAACSFGIYILHEPLQVWITYFFYQNCLNEYIKFAASTCFSLFLSWLLVQKILLKLPGLKRIF